MRHDLCCLLSILGGSYHLNFAQHLHSVMSRRHSDPVWLPEEPFVPKHSSASMKILLLVWAYGQKVYPKEHQRAPRLPKGTTAPPWKAASMLCSGHPRTGDRLTLSWLPLLTCEGAEVPFCARQRWGEAPTTAPSLLLPAQPILQNLRVSSPGCGETVPWQWEAAGTEESSGVGPLVGMPRARHSH